MESKKADQRQRSADRNDTAEAGKELPAIIGCREATVGSNAFSEQLVEILRDMDLPQVLVNHSRLVRGDTNDTGGGSKS